MAKPKCNNAEIYATMEQFHGGGMAKRVWFYFLCFQREAMQARSCDVFRSKVL
jgi:hypothetical protein